MDEISDDRPGVPADGTRQSPEARIAELEAQLATAQRLATTGVVAAMAIHEFRNIFTPLQNYARMAQHGSEKGITRTIELARDGAPRAEAICKALLEFAGGDPTRRETVNVGELVDGALAAMGRDLAKDGINLVRKIPATLTIETYPVQIQQVLLNLLLNAREAVLAKGRGKDIEIRATKRDGQVLLQVGDTGVGIRLEDRERVFEPFFTSGKDRGCGLGLAVCRQIAEGLDGQLSCRSQLGKGTWFTLSLPVEVAATRRRKTAATARSA